MLRTLPVHSINNFRRPIEISFAGIENMIENRTGGAAS